MNQITTSQNQTKQLDPFAIEAVLLGGDLSRMSPTQKVSYYNEVCELIGLNPLTKPFDYLKLNGKEVLYANKGCAEQLRSVHKIGLKIVDKQKIDDVYVVTAEALDPAGRTDSATGAVNVAGLKGENLANAMMKAETKAKRRVTLSICGLNMLDDTEVDSISGARRVVPDPVEEHEKLLAENGLTKSPIWTVQYGTLKGCTPEQIYNRLGFEDMEKSIDRTIDRIKTGVPYAGTNIKEMQETVDVLSKFLADIEREALSEEPAPSDEEPGEFTTFKGGFVTNKKDDAR